VPGGVRRADRTASGAPDGGARDALLRLQRGRGAEQRIEPADRDRRLPLAAAQQRLWFLDRWDPGSAAYNAPVALRLTGPLDTAVLGRALSGVVRRHEILRTRYADADGLPYQIVDEPAGVPLETTDLSALPAGEREEHVTRLVGEHARRPFDLATGPVLRAALFRLGDREHVLVLTMHHIATDGWSTAIVTREVVAGYTAETAGLPDPLPPLEIQFADFAVWQRRMLADASFQERLAYWTGHLEDLPVLDLPTDRPRPKEPTGAGSVYETVLPHRLQRAMVELARTAHVTQLTVALAAFQALLTRHTGQDDIVVGSVVNGRTMPQTEPLVGFFSNTLVLRTATGGDPTFRELLARTNDTVVGGLLHQDVPFGRVVDALQPEREPGRNPLFQVSFTLQQATEDTGRYGDLRVEQVPLVVGTSRFDMALQLTEVPGSGYRMWIEYSTELFDGERVERLAAHYRRLLQAVVADPDVRIGDVDLLDEAERADLVVAPNRTGRSYDTAGLCLHQLVERRVDLHPGRPAVRFLGQELSYAELDRRANRLAHKLRSLGIGPESRVGILLERGVELPVTELAVLKAGAAYVPLDPVHPANRLAYVLERSGAALVVTEGPLADALPEGTPLLDWRDPGLTADLAERPGTRPDVAVGPRNLAYVIFTSGSTGRPKGVLVEHRSAVNFTSSSVEMFALGTGDRMLQFANPAFDVSVFEIYSALACGATLVLAPRGTLLDPPSLTALMRGEGITTADIPPSVLALLDPADLPSLRNLFVGLEPFPGDLVDRWREGGRRAFHNGYGPTETTVASVDHLCGPQQGTSSPPIGRPLPNQYAYVLDPRGRPVPRGVVGELWIGGLGLSRGYAGAPGATAERFLPDPFAPAPGSRMYRTGDLALWRGDGHLEFAGRADAQVKIRGLRIEPGEIEQMLMRAPEVERAAVVVVTDPASGPQLVAYVVPAHGREADAAVLRGRLAEDLPPYMLPGAFVVLDALPLTGNGKLDRAALPAPHARSEQRRQSPASDAEKAVAAIWEGLLGRGDFVRDDNFFLVGGNSLQATQLLSRIRDTLGADVPLRSLFTHATIAQLGTLIEASARPAGGAAAPAARPVVLSAGGERPVLYCLHPSGGSVAPYVPLAASLGPGRPVHALEAPEDPGPDGDGDLVGRIAEAHAATILAARPEGPHLLAGWSTGGALAFETARRLRARGAAVALVALLDTDVPPGLEQPPSVAEALGLYAADLAGLGDLKPGAVDLGGLAELDTEEQFAEAARRLGAAGLAGTGPHGDGARGQLLRRMRTFVATVRAGSVWRPGTLDVPLVLFTSQTPGGDARARYWRSRTTGGFTHHRVGGDHYAVVAAPHVTAVARLLEQALDEHAPHHPRRQEAAA
jgi:amino acid adenylation domain-containing protein